MRLLFVISHHQVINHFTSRVEALIKANNGGNGSPTLPGSTSAIANNASVSEILEAIKKTAIEWPTDRLKKFPDLRFKYIEVSGIFIFLLKIILGWQHAGLLHSLHLAPHPRKCRYPIRSNGNPTVQSGLSEQNL